MNRGLVYILTNPCLDGWVKIGMTERNDIESRLNELNAPCNIPLAYRCYATYEVDNPREVEGSIHNLIDGVDSSLHAREILDNGRTREREFFRISKEAAYVIFYEIASLRGDLDKLKLYTPTANQVQEEEIGSNRFKRSNNSFERLGISVGQELTFLYDSSIRVEVSNSKNKVQFNGEIYTVSALARKILIEKYGWTQNLSVNGWRFFVFNDITLSDLRDKLELQEAECEDN